MVLRIRGEGLVEGLQAGGLPDNSITTAELADAAVTAAKLGTNTFVSYAILEDQKSAGTAGGTFNTGSFLTRDLNTEVADPDGIVSLSSNQFTLAAGNYFIVWSAPAYDSGRHKTQLFNATDSTVVGNGSSEYTLNTGAEQSRSVGSARVAITESKAFEIRHRAENGNGSNGYGVESNFGVVEVYTRVEIYKEA